MPIIYSFIGCRKWRSHRNIERIRFSPYLQLMVAEREREIERTRKVLSLKVCASPWWYWWPFRWRSYDLERSWRQSVFVGDWHKPFWLLINDILYETASLRTVNSGHHRSYIKTQGVRSWLFDFCFFQLVIFYFWRSNCKIWLLLCDHF